MNPPIRTHQDYLDAIGIISETNSRAVKSWNTWKRQDLPLDTRIHSTDDPLKQYIWGNSVATTTLLRGRDANELLEQCAQYEIDRCHDK